MSGIFLKTSLITARVATVFAIFAFLSVSSLFAQSLVTQWKGVNAAWRDSVNWDKGVPDSTRKVTISLGIPNYSDPFVSAPLGTDTASTGVLTIQSGGRLFFDADGVLLVYGNEKIQNDGSISLGSGAIIFRNNLGFLNGGIFDAGSGTVTFSGGAWDNKIGATFIAGTSTVVFDGSGTQAFDADASFSFYNLVLQTQGNVTITGNITVLNSCYVAAGCTLNIPTGSTFTVIGTFISDGIVTGDGLFTLPLPVQLSSFSATANGLSAVLRWTTETEINNYGFEVERRFVSGSQFTLPGAQWQSVAFIEGAGTSNRPRVYSFTDGHLSPGRYAYRLKQIDFNGSSVYHHAAEIDVGIAPHSLSLGQNYPNPFNPTTTIEFTLPNAGHVTLKIYNVLGQTVATLFDGHGDPGRVYQATFDAVSLPSGHYFVRLHFADQALMRKIILVR